MSGNRVAIYARYSSDLQREASIEDQVALARQYAERNGWTVVEVYADAAISGATLMQRPAMNKAIADARAGCWDILLTESLDRLARDAEHQLHIHNQMKFARVSVVTLADGAVTPLIAGLKGAIAAQHNVDLAQKVRRGQSGRVKGGKVGTGRAPYGYRKANTAEERGLREIDEAKAVIVRRIFAEYVAGRSALKIARGLNRDGIPSPGGVLWGPLVIRGTNKLGSGMLNNEMYVGRITYGKRENARDPSSQKKTSRRSKGDIIRGDAPDLRIIDDATWEAVHRAMDQRTKKPGASARRPAHMLSGLIRCGVCGAPYVVVSGLPAVRGYLGCKNRKINTCTNSRTVSRREVEQRSLVHITSHLLEPETIKVAVAAYHERRRERARELGSRTATLKTELAEAQRKLAAWEKIIEAGADPKEAAQRFNSLTSDRNRIQALLDEAKQDTVVDLHPRAVDRLRQGIEQLASLSGDDAETLKAVALVRNFISAIEVHPTPRGKPVDIRVRGEIEALLDVAEETIEEGKRQSRRG